jgi:hypothetical protein
VTYSVSIFGNAAKAPNEELDDVVAEIRTLVDNLRANGHTVSSAVVNGRELAWEQPEQPAQAEAPAEAAESTDQPAT